MQAMKEEEIMDKRKGKHAIEARGGSEDCEGGSRGEEGERKAREVGTY
jgi:hypothetical protein